MKLPLFFFISLLSTSSLAQQQETFDLITYAAPAGWNKSGDTNVIGYSTTNKKTGTYCQLGIYASTNSQGNSLADFKSEWQILIAKTYKPSNDPEPISTPLTNGWTAQRGVAPFQFDGAESAAMLVTMSGYGRCMSIVILSNTKDYFPVVEKFLASVELEKIEALAPPSTVTTAPDVNNDDAQSVVASG
ncbi:hypothetical protein BH10BAC4_BH10BAC4_20130 [soil metagenome]